MPNPCSGPIACNVFKIIRSSVPCRISDFVFAMPFPLDIANRISSLLWNVQRCNLHTEIIPDQRRSVYRGVQTSSKGNWLRKKPTPHRHRVRRLREPTFPAPLDRICDPQIPLTRHPLYVSDTQIGVMLPSQTPLGDALVTVTVQGETSVPAGITVVRRNFGVFAVNQAGSGPAILQNFISDTNQPLNSLLTPAR